MHDHGDKRSVAASIDRPMHRVISLANHLKSERCVLREKRRPSASVVRRAAAGKRVPRFDPDDGSRVARVLPWWRRFQCSERAMDHAQACALLTPASTVDRQGWPSQQSKTAYDGNDQRRNDIGGDQKVWRVVRIGLCQRLFLCHQLLCHQIVPDRKPKNRHHDRQYRYRPGRTTVETERVEPSRCARGSEDVKRGGGHQYPGRNAT